jgi:hypothetical protein
VHTLALESANIDLVASDLTNIDGTVESIVLYQFTSAPFGTEFLKDIFQLFSENISEYSSNSIQVRNYNMEHSWAELEAAEMDLNGTALEQLKYYLYSFSNNFQCFFIHINNFNVAPLLWP